MKWSPPQIVTLESRSERNFEFFPAASVSGITCTKLSLTERRLVAVVVFYRPLSRVVVRRMVHHDLAVGIKRVRCVDCTHTRALFTQVLHMACQSSATVVEVFNLLPAGEFIMGSDELNEHPYYELPKRKASIARPFLAGRFPVTTTQWDSIGGDDSREFTGPDTPINQISPNSVSDWFRKTGDILRFPTEEEWEYACRAGTDTAYYWGDEMLYPYCMNSDESEMRDVSDQMPGFDFENYDPSFSVYDRELWCNAFGLVDILGHVSEFTSSNWFGWDNSRESEDRLEDLPQRIVMKGGNQGLFNVDCRCSSRFAMIIQGADCTSSFRVFANVKLVCPSEKSKSNST